MDFESQLNAIVETITERKEHVKTEEATKMTFVIPFLKALGYDVYNPKIVVPEYTADVGTKKGEKVDYAIFKSEKPFILIEAKNHTEDLDKHKNQLIRYFMASGVKFAILTNGVEYRFFTDIEKTNCMDQDPFLVVDLENLRRRDINDLKRFVCANLDLEEISSVARKKKYCRNIQEMFKNEIEDPSNDFVTFFAKQLTERRMTDAVKEEFKDYIKDSLRELINDLAEDQIIKIKNKIQEKDSPQSLDENEETTDRAKEIVTTEEKLQGFYIVKSILGSAGVNLDEVSYKDTLSYFSILYQGKVTKWICRLYFNIPKKKIISLPNESTNRNTDKLEDLYSLKENIIKAFKFRE